MEPLPETKNVITKSSNDIVTAIIKPERIPGIIAGIITLSMVCFSVAPRSWAASIIEKSNSSILAVTIRYTKGKQKVVWAAKIVNNPKGTFIPAKKISIETPIITSGKIMGRKLMVCIYERPRNLYQFIPMAAIVPKIDATAAEEKAIITLFPRASHNSWESQNSFLYHIKENSVKSELFPALNEKTTIKNKGKKR